MKGLMKKDFYILKNQWKFLVCVGIFCTVYGVMIRNPYFMSGYLSATAGILAAGTIGYDELNKGFSFLFTLPVSRKVYVVEKYLFSLIISLAGMLLLTAAVGLAALIGSGNISLEALLGCCAGSFVGTWAIIIIMIPLKLKYDGEKGRLVFIAVFLAAGLAGAGIIKILSLVSIDLPEMFVHFMENAGPFESLFAAAVLLAVLTILSYLGSRRIVEKKEY